MIVVVVCGGELAGGVWFLCVVGVRVVVWVVGGGWGRRVVMRGCCGGGGGPVFYTD